VQRSPRLGDIAAVRRRRLIDGDLPAVRRAACCIRGLHFERESLPGLCLRRGPPANQAVAVDGGTGPVGSQRPGHALSARSDAHLLAIGHAHKSRLRIGGHRRDHRRDRLVRHREVVKIGIVKVRGGLTPHPARAPELDPLHLGWIEAAAVAVGVRVQGRVAEPDRFGDPGVGRVVQLAGAGSENEIEIPSPAVGRVQLQEHRAVAVVARFMMDAQADRETRVAAADVGDRIPRGREIELVIEVAIGHVMATERVGVAAPGRHPGPVSCGPVGVARAQVDLCIEGQSAEVILADHFGLPTDRVGTARVLPRHLEGELRTDLPSVGRPAADQAGAADGGAGPAVVVERPVDCLARNIRQHLLLVRYGRLDQLRAGDRLDLHRGQRTRGHRVVVHPP